LAQSVRLTASLPQKKKAGLNRDHRFCERKTAVRGVWGDCVWSVDAGDDRVKRLTANDIIGHFLKHREFEDLEGRIQRIEQQLETRR
jgi:hypothetical protein